MLSLASLCQIVIAAGLINVWMIRYGRPTAFRPDGAENMREEFRAYGLPDWAVWAVGTCKLSCAALLLMGAFVPAVTPIAATAVAVLMLGAVVAHVRVNDPMAKAVPALSMLGMSSFVVISTM